MRRRRVASPGDPRSASGARRTPDRGDPARLVRALAAGVALALAATPAAGQQAGPGQGGESGRSDAGLDGAAERFLDHVQWLAADAREGRGIGTDGLAEAGAWLEERFRAIGVEPGAADASYRQPFPVRSRDEAHAGLAAEAFNVIGRVPAGAPQPLPGAILIGAHYDHLGMGGASSLAPDSPAIHNGADDNASGTAALLEVARRLVERRDELRRDVYLVAFSAEELGNVGSSAFLHAPPPGLALEDVVAMLNMDMVGRLREDRLSVLGGESAEEWPAVVEPRCVELALSCSIRGDGFGASDHASFYAAGIPVLHFFTGAHSEYHTPEDDAGLIDARGGARIARLVEAVALDVASRETALTLRRSAEAPARTVMRGGARLGTVPDYAGPADGRPGVLLSAVRAGSPAEAAGLRRGDLLVGLGGREIRTIEDFMGVLQEAEPGQRATAVVEREGSRLELEVMYGAPGDR